MHPSPDKEEPEKKPPSRDPAEFDPSERKFWESDEDEEPEGEAPSAEALPSSKASKRPTGLRNTRRSRKNSRRSRPKDPKGDPKEPVESKDDPDDPKDDLTPSENELDRPGDDLEEAEEDFENPEEELEYSEEEPDDQDDDVEDRDDFEEEPEDQEGLEDSGPEDRPAAGDQKSAPSRTPEDPVAEKRRFSGADLVWMGVLGLFLLGIGIYALGLFFKNVQPSGSPEDVKFPVKGERVVIGKIETYWRKPNPDDTVSLNARLIPCAKVKLKSGTGSGRLRFFFENDEGQFVGDPVTLSFSSGTFDSSGESSADLYSTEGFEHEGEYAAYLTENFNYWHVNVLEGPEGDQDGEEFEKLTRVRISPKRR